MGKTAWARSLGRHSYFSEKFNVNKYDVDCEYSVFDDINIHYLPSYKGWLGSQEEFDVNVKYGRDRTIIYGKPTIWLTNIDPRAERPGRHGDISVDVDWLNGNCEFVFVNAPLY